MDSTSSSEQAQSDDGEDASASRRSQQQADEKVDKMVEAEKSDIDKINCEVASRERTSMISP